MQNATTMDRARDVRSFMAAPASSTGIGDTLADRSRSLEAIAASARSAAAEAHAKRLSTRRPYLARTLRWCALAAALLLMLVLTPLVANASAMDNINPDLLDPFGTATRFVKALLIDAINGLLGGITDYMTTNSRADLFGAQWDNLFGGGGANTLSALVSAICNTIVKPVAASILVFVVLVQLIKIASRMDGAGTVPAIKEIIVLFVMLAIFMWLVQNSDQLCIAIYDVFRQMTAQVQGMASAGQGNVAFDYIPTDIDSINSTDTGTLFIWLIAALIGLVIALAAAVLAMVMIYARAIQLYIMMAFSPIPLAFLGIDETRSFGVGFLKNFAALALSGLIMYVIFIAWPYVIASIATGAQGDLGLTIIGPIAASLLMCLGLIKSGAWARDILGS